MPTLSDFTKLLQDTLNRLYDSPYLQSHPLTELLVDRQNGTLQSSQDLRRILLQAIHAMRPQASTPAQSADWRYYRILELRYIEGIQPAEIMERLSVSKSQYFRDQSHILEALAADLWARRQASTTTSAESRGRDDLAHSEVERLRTEAEWQFVDVERLLEELHISVDALAQAKSVHLHLNVPHSLSGLRADRVMLRQTLFNAVTYALDLCQGGNLYISTFCNQRESGIALFAEFPDAPDRRNLEMRPGVGLQVSAELMVAMAGELIVKAESRSQWGAYLTWPIVDEPLLLVIDDNEEFTNLCRRYLAAFKWQVLGATSGVEARRIVSEKRPTVILQDIMMPKEDGWELLMAFKAAQATQEIPVIICSVLNEAELAKTLGATAYLAKPLSQQRLLRALARWTPTDTILQPTP